MPTIQTELRVQVEGGQAPVLVRRIPLEVHSCEQISLFVEGVKPAQPPPAATASGATQSVGKKAAKKKAQKRIVQATYSPPLKNVRFVAIYDAGQGNGLRVKVGGAKFATLEQPLIFAHGAAAKFNSKSSIILQNESALPRTAVMLVGSDLAKDDRKVMVIKRTLPAAKAGAAAPTAANPRKRSSGKRKK
jgi:hypothetical protein